MVKELDAMLRSGANGNMNNVDTGKTGFGEKR